MFFILYLCKIQVRMILCFGCVISDTISVIIKSKNNILNQIEIDMNIKVCVGSSCHLKGSYDVIEAFKAVMKKYDVEDVVDLQASFCLGHCAKGVTVNCEGMEAAEKGPQVEQTADGFILHSVNAENVEELFAKEIYPKIFNV